MKLLSALFFLFLLTLTLLPTVQAAEFNQLTVKLNRTAINSNIDATICAKASNPGSASESALHMTFPTSFSISSAESDWTTSYTDLPSGSTNWPGISTNPTSISGNTLIFDSSNLTTNTLYCFRLVSTASNTGSSTGNKVGTVISKTGSNTTINNQNYALNIVSSDRITLNATVPANPADFQADLTQITSGTTFSPNTNVQYQITYGSYLNSTSNITVEAEWTKGNNTIDILDFVPGSATNAHNNTPPVIDVANRKITWTINNFPASTADKKVYFTLKTNESYIGSTALQFTVSARILGPGTQTPDSSIIGYYQYPQPGTATPGPTATPTPTPSPLAFSNIVITSLTDTTAGIRTTLSSPAKLQIRYGTSLQITSSLTDTLLSTTHQNTLTNLLPDTMYYFKITATDANGNTTSSNIYTLQTAAPEQSLPTIRKDTLVITSQNIILKDSTSQTNFTLIPTNTDFDFRVSLQEHKNIKSITASLNDANTLQEVDLIEISPGVYAGRFKTPQGTEIYSLSLKIKTLRGTIRTEQLEKIIVSKPLRVIDHKSKEPIEDAQVTLFIWNEKNQRFIAISPQTLAIKNPLLTLSDGTAPIVLPPGKYKVEVNAFGYKNTEKEFEIGRNESDTYPEIQMTTTFLDISGIIKHLLRIVPNLFIDNTFAYLTTIAVSKRAIQIISIASLLSFTVLLLIALKTRLHISLKNLPFYLASFALRERQQVGSLTLAGKVLDSSTKLPIKHATIFITTVGSEKLLTQTVSGKNGEFKITRLAPGSYHLTVLNYKYQKYEVSRELKNEEIQEIKVELASHKNAKDVLKIATHTVTQLLGNSFETLLLLILIISILAGINLGWKTVAPFIIIALLNIILFTLHHLPKE